ncbi:hypothetical protein LSAT2_005071 [Lamellibrachia satsuma]|nr:hypothetical protein LSAT2_005071 [Lamellibrachia satsuma]
MLEQDSESYFCLKLFLCAASEIQTRERTSIREAAGLLVDQLLECSEPGWFQAFIDALKQSGYDALVRQLEGEEPTEVIKADKLYRALLSVFAPALYKIKPSELIPYLVSTECLSDVDEEEIRLRERNEGATIAADLLLERIHRRNEYYFLHFMEALRQNGYQRVVDEIEPAFSKACNLEGAMNVVEQMHRVYQNDVGEAGSSQLDRQEELRMQYIDH